MSSTPSYFSLAIIFPAYNEEARLGETLEKAAQYFQHLEFQTHVIVVDDGSIDRTVEVAEQYRMRFASFQVIKHVQNMGKGAAVRTGMLSANADLHLLADSDGATPFPEFERLFRALKDQGGDLAIGSRAIVSSETKISTNAIRKYLGRLWNLSVKYLAVPGIADTQCGFKLFRHPVSHFLFSRQRCNGYAFDVEILRMAQKVGFKILEVPVNWNNIAGSKVHVIRDGIKMFFQLIKIRQWHKELSAKDLPASLRKS